MDKAIDVLQRTFGYSEFRAPQADVIDAVVAGSDVLVVMPTGGGKSLCYQIPSMLRPGVGLVVSPLIALMQDQVDALAQVGIKAAYLNSTQSASEQARVWSGIEAGTLSMLYIAPERLLQPDTLSRLSHNRIALIAIDEAHCVSQWGHDFRRDYLGLAPLADVFPGVPRIALTATATPRTRKDIVTNLKLRAVREWVAGFDRPNLTYRVHIKTDPRRQVSQFVARYRGQPGIIYALSRKKVESTAQWLVDSGVNALPYHAGLDTAVRAEHQKRFLREDDVVMCATIAFGMGIDKPDVRFVAHLDLPKSVEAYYQETGRAGRDGAPSEVLMVYGLQDVVRLRQMVDESDADEMHKRSERNKLDALLGWCETTECRRRGLLAYFGETMDGACGNCDVCLSPPPVYDGTVEAQKLLSAVYRTGQRFGAAHVIDVLLGRETDKVAQHGHNGLAVFGAGRDTDARQWRSVLRQLVGRGFVTADAARYGALVLSDTCRPLLRGETALTLRKDVRPAPGRRAAASFAGETLSDVDRALFEQLRETRAALARENGVPAYVIFHDTTLRQMALHKPASMDDLMAIGGVGATKRDRYGDAFLQVIVEAN
ncbi:MAG: DNA helicase RecQ [Pseudomonadota bacterium]